MLNRCLECELEIESDRTGYKDGKPVYRKFCSKSCAAKFNNKKSPKRKPEGTCAKCLSPCLVSRKYCPTCWSKDELAEKTKAQVYQAAKYQKGAVIRGHARKIYKESSKVAACLICNYDFHVDICHIKAVSNFADTATLAEINHTDNLIALCRNHHWEFDHNGPAKKEIEKLLYPY